MIQKGEAYSAPPPLRINTFAPFVIVSVDTEPTFIVPSPATVTLFAPDADLTSPAVDAFATAYVVSVNLALEGTDLPIVNPVSFTV